MLSSHLQNMGYQKDLLAKYKKGNWLESLGYGAYKLSGDAVGWYSAVAALQQQKQSTIHPGGKTALELSGLAHYLKKQQRETKLFGAHTEKLPAWFTKQSWGVTVHYTQTKLFAYADSALYTIATIDGVELAISIPEMAIMEMLFEVPKKQSFDEAFRIMENLTTLRPGRAQYLLEKCNSVKVKRLFMWMAERINHHWVNDIEASKLDFGSGDRMIIKGGVYDKKYRITVPGAL